MSKIKNPDPTLGEPQAKLVEVAPGRFTLAPAGRRDPEVALCHVIPLGDGEYKLMPECVTWARVTGALLKSMGLSSQWLTLYRLARAGFIELVRVAPHTYLLNLDSWFGHLQRCAEDEEFWEKGSANREEYRRAL